MRVIFTDIDGVLNPHWKSEWSKSSITIYNQLCEEYDLKPVISSTWRENHTMHQLQEIFTKQGIEAQIYDYTPIISGADRGEEIKEWLSENPVDDWVIIDDITRNIEPHIGNVVKVRNWVGLTTEEYLQIKKILDNENYRTEN
jgi:hypothetical protein